jgi:hypothetical protein
MYRFPFAFAFPTETITTNEIQTVMREPPPSFFEIQSAVMIQYNLKLTFVRGKLKTDSRYGSGFWLQQALHDQFSPYRINTRIVYMPKSIESPASEKRQLAYREGSFLPAPKKDPEGWHPIPAVNIRGKFRDREAFISCSVSFSSFA